MKHPNLNTVIALFLAIFFVQLISAKATTGTFTPCYIGTTTSADGRTGQPAAPWGYYIYLPSAFYTNPSQKLPILYFWHGAGEGGDGTSSASTGLPRTLGQGPSWMLNNAYDSNTAHYGGSYNPEGGTYNDPTHPGGVFEANSCIVVCAQAPGLSNSTWQDWQYGGTKPMRQMMDFITAVYGSHIDTTRIYMTGLSNGTQAIATFLNNDFTPDQLTATFMAAYTGVVPDNQAKALAPILPLWVLDDRGDGIPSNLVDPYAGYFLGGGSTNVLGTEPLGGGTNTANFGGSTWAWVTGVIDGTATVNPKLTRFANNVQDTGSTHRDSWLQAYNSPTPWTWLFAHIKPTVSITTPSTSSVILSHGTSITFTGSAHDHLGTSLTNLVWTSSIDGVLYTGTTFSTSTLSYGPHNIRCQAADSTFTGQHADVLVTVPYTNPFTVKCNFEAPSQPLPGSNWNTIVGGVSNNSDATYQMSGYQAGAGVIPNAVDSSTGVAVGVKIAITQSFDGYSTDGTVSTALYPSPVQTYGFKVGGTHVGQVTITGLNPSQAYNFTAFGSSSAGAWGTVTYTLAGTPVTMSIVNNTSNTASWTGVHPDATGTVVLNVACSASGANEAALGALTITSSGSGTAPTITNGPPPSGIAGKPYSFTYTATGSPTPTFTMATGTLPPGLTLSSSGTISGTPTTAGTYTGLSVTASNAGGSATTPTFSIVIKSIKTILINLGHSPAVGHDTTNNLWWNDIAAGTIYSGSALHDTTNASSSLTFSVANGTIIYSSNSSGSTVGFTNPNTGTVYSTAAAGCESYIGFSPAAVTIGGLDTSGSTQYTFTFYGSSGSDATSTSQNFYALSGGTTYAYSAGVTQPVNTRTNYNNASPVPEVSPTFTPTSSTVTITESAVGGNSQAWDMWGTLEITVVH